MEKVIAVVVTYNRQSLLSECINALRSQTRRLDAILVVNNGSTDSTEEWLKKQSDVFFVSQKNVGSISPADYTHHPSATPSPHVQSSNE